MQRSTNTATGGAFSFSPRAEGENTEVFSSDVTGRSLEQVGNSKVVLQGKTKVVPKGRGLESLAGDLRSMEIMFLDPHNKERNFADKPRRVIEAFQQIARTSLASDEITIELLMAVYRSNGSASFRKQGYRNPAQELVLNGPLQAAPAPDFGGRVLTLTTLHVSIFADLLSFVCKDEYTYIGLFIYLCFSKKKNFFFLENTIHIFLYYYFFFTSTYFN